ncbi:MAG: type II secretion system protein M [Burkholderiaceae bacterium]|jgi:general secretion pathway protein M|nr:type II secretion system protein M [Burkholderiaceae bacterium]
MMDRLAAFWNERAPRERAVLALLGLIVLLAVAYLALVEPAVTGIQRLERGLPQVRTQAAQLDALLADVKAVKARPQVATVSSAEARGALDKSLAAAGLKAARIVPLSDGDLQLTFANVPYAAWSVWLAGLERELGARAIGVVANANGTPGNVDVELALRLARR